MTTISDAPSRAMTLAQRIVPQRLEHQISLLVATLVAVCIFFLALHIANEQAESATDAASIQAKALIHNIAATSSTHIMGKDIAALDGMLLRIAQFPGVEEIVVTDKGGVMLSQVNTTKNYRPQAVTANTVLALPAHAQTTVDETNKILTIWHAIKSDRDQPVGWVKLSQSLKFIDAAKTEIWLDILGDGAIAILLTTLVLLLFLRRPMGSISTAIEFAKTLTNKTGKTITIHSRSSELRALGSALNKASLALYTQTKTIDKVRNDLKSQKDAMDQHAIISVTDTQGRITYTNKAFCRVSAYTPDELIGRNHSMLNSGYHPASFFYELWRTLKKHGVWHGEIMNRDKNGKTYWLDATIVSLHNELEQRQQYMSICTDITRLKDIEISLRTSESRLLQTQSVGHIGSWEWYIGSNDMYWSKQAWNIFDVSSTDFKPTYDEFLATIHPDDLKSVSTALNACIKYGKEYDQEFRIVTPSGETRWLQVRGDTLCNPGGQAEKLLGVVQDISSRKTADLAVEEIRARLERLLKNSPTVIYSIPSVHSPHPDYISANIRTLLGYDAQDVIDHNDFWATHIHPDDLHVLNNIHEELPHMMTERFVYRMQHKHGDYIWLQDLRRVSKSSQGNTDQVVGTLTNITELKKTQGQLDRRNIELETLRRSLAWKVKLRTAELEEANIELQRLNQVKSEFISTVSHELRTPLTSIKSFAEILLEDDEGMDTQTKANFLSIILQETDRLARLVSNVLDLQKIDAGKTDWHDKLVDIGAMVHSAAKMFTTPFHRNGVKLVHTAGEGVNTVVDADKIRQVLSNLLSNALKFTYEGKVEITAKILPAPDRGKPDESTEIIEVSVSDSGCGIPESDISNIFDRFYQSDHHSERMSEGTGLGLAICREIIKHYGGDLWVNSKIDEGSTFTFTLPIYNRLKSPDETNPGLRGLLYQKEIDNFINHRTH
ncbi:MAG TPA: PAS domain-containing sensor histidine kinase [Acidiferrobacteraceae bacterium]|nr:PAS domain-containing sensor histidine kinase [Acidiferrobacteraceae bacterium]